MKHGFAYRCVFDYSDPSERRRYDEEYHKLHPPYGKEEEFLKKWLEEHPQRDGKTADVMIVVNNPMGQGVLETAIQRVIGIAGDIGEWWVKLRMIEALGEVTIVEE